MREICLVSACLGEMVSNKFPYCHDLAGAAPPLARGICQPDLNRHRRAKADASNHSVEPGGLKNDLRRSLS